METFTVSVTDKPPVVGPIANQTMSKIAQGSLNLSVSASDPDGDPITLAAKAGDMGYALTTIYNLQLAGSFYTNSLGANLQEKWVKGLNNRFGNPWYFITPALQLFAWDGTSSSPISANEAPLATLDQPIYYANPALLCQSTPSDLASATQKALGLHVSSSGMFFYGRPDKWLQDSAGTWYYITPQGQFYRWGGTSSTTADVSLATFGVTYYGPPGSTTAPPLATPPSNPVAVAINPTGPVLGPVSGSLSVTPSSAFTGDIWVVLEATDVTNGYLRFTFQYFKVTVTP